jgi:hypothetical protein
MLRFDLLQLLSTIDAVSDAWHGLLLLVMAARMLHTRLTRRPCRATNTVPAPPEPVDPT